MGKVAIKIIVTLSRGLPKHGLVFISQSTLLQVLLRLLLMYTVYVLPSQPFELSVPSSRARLCLARTSHGRATFLPCS